MKYHYMRAAGYDYVRYDRTTHCHILREISTGFVERWIKCEPHDNLGIVYKNTKLRFYDIMRNDEIE